MSPCVHAASHLLRLPLSHAGRVPQALDFARVFVLAFAIRQRRGHRCPGMASREQPQPKKKNGAPTSGSNTTPWYLGSSTRSPKNLVFLLDRWRDADWEDSGGVTLLLCILSFEEGKQSYVSWKVFQNLSVTPVI